MINRTHYIDQLVTYVDKPFVKIITGVRRSGKSYLLMLLKQHLMNMGILERQIVYINLESFTFSHLNDANNLYDYVTSTIDKNEKIYVLIDEIQEITHWEKAITSLMVDFTIDIYLTGSNAHLLSSELATYLAGRYVEIPVYTLSFSEYLTFKNYYNKDTEHSIKESFQDYIQIGGFPFLHSTPFTFETAYKLLYDIYSSVILRDTVQRYNIRDVELLERVIKYTFDNVGNTFSGKNIADYFKSQQRRLDVNTVYNYLKALEGAYILYRVPRYDIRGKELLKTQEKYYISDIGFLYATMGYSTHNINGILENIVFLELKRRGYQVYVGKIDQKEIDFIAEKTNTKLYIQVAYQMNTDTTLEREYASLLQINDQFPKFVVSMDDFRKESYLGIQHLYIADFLLSNLF